MARMVLFLGLMLLEHSCSGQRPERSLSAPCILETAACPHGSLVDPLLAMPMERTARSSPILPAPKEGRSTGGRVGIGALIGLGVGGVLGLMVASGQGESIGSPGPAYTVGVIAGAGAVVGGLVGLISGLGSGGGGMPYPGY